MRGDALPEQVPDSTRHCQRLSVAFGRSDERNPCENRGTIGRRFSKQVVANVREPSRCGLFLQNNVLFEFPL